MVRSNSIKGSRAKSPSNQTVSEKTKPRKARSKVLDAKGHHGSDGGNTTAIEEIVVPTVVSPQAEESKAIKGEELISSLSVNDGKNEVVLALFRLSNRLFKLRISLNGIEMRPSTYTGRNSAMSYWELIKERIMRK